MKFLLFSGCLLSVSVARAQLITDPLQAIAARDTLLHEADHVRQLVQQSSAFYTSNAVSSGKRRVVVRGHVVPSPTALMGKLPVEWKQLTRYRHNGRVQQSWQLRVSGTPMVQQEWLNGRPMRVVLLRPLPGTSDKLPRHLGSYLASGFVTLDKKQYALPQNEQP